MTKFPGINQIYSNVKNVKIYNKDILKFNLEKQLIKILLFLATYPIIFSQILVGILKFKKWPPNFNDLVLMFQKELEKNIRKIQKKTKEDYLYYQIIN